MTSPRSWLSAMAMLVLGLAGRASAEPALAKIDSGPLVGSAESGVAVYKGIPFAAPPVGELRWAPPQSPARWTAPRPADRFGSVCTQPLRAGGGPNGGGVAEKGSEDCLFLNVWAPAKARHAPVMVWIHGGSNTTGAGSVGGYDGTAFARDGVVLVSLNYRLGAFGFFAHPALTAAAKADEPLADYGLMDQLAALRWVQRNISAFGGDPRNVTVFGESAGGIDVVTLLTAKSAKGLFAKAIVESGAGWGPPSPLSKREAKGEAAAVAAGLKPGATLVDLRALPAQAVLDMKLGDGDITVDGRLLTQSPTQAFAAGNFLRVPLIIGTNSWEASLMRSFNMPASAVLAITPASLKAAYADDTDDETKAQHLFTDAFMGAPARWIARQAQGDPVWLYHFAYVPEARRTFVPGAGHASEIPFVFASWDHLGALRERYALTSADEAMTARVHACWVAFAKTGAPSCPGTPPWPAYSTANDALMDFDVETGVKAHFKQARYDAQEAVNLPRFALGR